MLSAINNAIVGFTNWIWGIPMLFILVGGGLVIFFQIGGLQVKHFGLCMKQTIGKSLKGQGGEGATGFKVVCAALSGTIGTGNIVGVGTAICMGGPGAIFWMEVVGFVAMGIKYAEAALAVKYRRKDEQGNYYGGAYYYIKDGLKGNFGKIMGYVYFIGLIVSLILAAGVHTGSTIAAAGQMNIPKIPVLIAALIVIALIIYGGVTLLLDITDKLVPGMTILYIVTGIVVIVMNIQNLPSAFLSIFQYAFTGRAAVGGFAGAAFAQTLRFGLARGMYSNDAGNGIASIIHARSNVQDPAEQGMWGVFEVFADTTIVCTFTALIILCSGQWMVEGESGATLAIHSFGSTLGGFGTIVASVSLMLFAMSTCMSFASFVGLQAEPVWGKAGRLIVQVIYMIMMVLGALAGVDNILFYTDTGNALCILTSLVTCVLLSGELRNLTKEYLAKILPAKK